MRSCSSSSSIKEYAHKVAREAKMDIDLEPDINKSWADQVDATEATAQTPIGAQLVYKASTPPPSGPAPSVIPYDANQPADPSLWDGNLRAVSIFRTKEFFTQDAANIVKSLDRAAIYIRQRDLSCGDPNSLPQLNSFGDTAWNFVTAIYESKWDQLLSSSNTSFRENVAAQFRQPTKGKKPSASSVCPYAIWTPPNTCHSKNMESCPCREAKLRHVTPFFYLKQVVSFPIRFGLLERDASGTCN